MGVYLFLCLLPYLLKFISSGFKDLAKRDKFISWTFFAVLYVVLSMRDLSVGRDILHYKEAFDMAADYDWFYTDWIYMESGYIFLMKLAQWLGLSFRAFLAVLYLVVIIPTAEFIRRFSKDVALSIELFMCFQFFVFYMSAFRQTLALGLCLMAFMAARKDGIGHFLLFLLLVSAAMLIHRSSFIFLPVYFLLRKRLDWKMVAVYAVIVALALIYRRPLLRYLQDAEITTHDFQQDLAIGMMFLVLVLIIVVQFFFFNKGEALDSGIHVKKSILAPKGSVMPGVSNYSNLLVCSAILLLTFSGTILMRASTFYQAALLLLVPNMFAELSPSLRKLASIVTVVLLVAMFYFTTLLPNQLDIVPYVIWQGPDIL